jgi:hypothetical protein
MAALSKSCAPHSTAPDNVGAAVRVDLVATAFAITDSAVEPGGVSASFSCGFAEN